MVDRTGRAVLPDWAPPMADPALLERLFSRVPDVVFFVKDREGR